MLKTNFQEMFIFLFFSYFSVEKIFHSPSKPFWCTHLTSLGTWLFWQMLHKIKRRTFKQTFCRTMFANSTHRWLVQPQYIYISSYIAICLNHYAYNNLPRSKNEPTTVAKITAAATRKSQCMKFRLTQHYELLHNIK